MDLGFFRRSRSDSAGRTSAPLDFGMLTASLHAFQSASLTARAHAQAPGSQQDASLGHSALVELLIAGPEWRDAIEQQGGSFNTAYARQRGSDA